MCSPILLCLNNHLNFADRVVFMSYNILGVKNAAAHEDLYRNVSPKYLDWDYRKKLICKEIRKYNPGIMCFQVSFKFKVSSFLYIYSSKMERGGR